MADSDDDAPLVFRRNPSPAEKKVVKPVVKTPVKEAPKPPAKPAPPPAAKVPPVAVKPESVEAASPDAGKKRPAEDKLPEEAGPLKKTKPADDPVKEEIMKEEVDEEEDYNEDEGTTAGGDGDDDESYEANGADEEDDEGEAGAEEEEEEEEDDRKDGDGEELAPRQSMKAEDDSDEDVPLAQRAQAVVKTETVASQSRVTKERVDKKQVVTKKVVVTKKTTVEKKKGSSSNGSSSAPGSGGGVKWKTLEHCGVIFPPPYQSHGIRMLYDGKPVQLTPEQEEVATMFAVMKDTDYATKPVFIKNFWTDWKQEKKRLKEEKMVTEEKYMWALVDGVKEKVGNFRVEPPGLFRGRGEHPKMGKLKKRIWPEDIVINVGKDAPQPPCPLPGHRWKEIRHDNTVTWLAYWNDPINNREFKYVFLAASSNLKGLSDKENFLSHQLEGYVENIRITYTKHFDSKDVQKRQIAVATYLIDRLALRAGNEKDEDEADTVGCCSLKVEHVTLVPPHSLQFDFLGKDSIRYFNKVEVEPKVYRAVGDFQKGKRKDDDIFDKLDTSKLNAHLKDIMPGLTAKVFRTYNASITLDNLLQDTAGSSVQEIVADYQRANKEVAILCNHQRSVSKAHAGQMEKLEGKLAELEGIVEELEVDLDRARKNKPPLKKDKDDAPKRQQSVEQMEKKLEQTKKKIDKMQLDMKVKEDLKTVALGTSKINYMDPRISVSWCKRHDVPIEKIFNKSLLAKFAWAMDVPPDFRF
eukprot:jgi/Mesen1/3053/ME000018S02365